MLHPCKLKLLGQLGLVEKAALITLDIAPGQRRRHGFFIDRAHERVVSIQRIIVVTQGIAQGQALADTVIQRRPQRCHFGTADIHVPGIGRAVIGAGRHIDRPALVRGDTEVRQATVLQIVGLQQHAGVRAGLDQHRCRKRLAIEKLLVAVAVGALDGAGQAIGDRTVLRRTRQVELAAALVPASQSQSHFAEIDAGLLGDAVDQAARRATSVQHRCRALEHFYLLDIG
ncbi:hypothetical protein SDC9_134578 [bioreactor metagenome]|uniref:Uncharacterized protein n=1 Tax=bioreactor metagenome TaxID=1076179 RepID=A0A645DFY0_9ZZZZ